MNTSLPVKTAQPAAAASKMLWPAKPGKNEPPTTAIGVNPYKCLNSPAKTSSEGYRDLEVRSP